jgi:hypothetical protein
MRRLLISLPPLLLLLAGLAMAVATPFAWGAGAHAGLPDWMTASSGALFATPALYISGKTLLQVMRRTDGEFTVISLQLVLGVFLFIVLGFIEVVLAFRIADPRTYDSLITEDGEIHTPPTSFFLITLIGTAFAAAWLSAGAFLYANGLLEDGSRFVRSLDEPDLMAEFLRGRRPRR